MKKIFLILCLTSLIVGGCKPPVEELPQQPIRGSGNLASNVVNAKVGDWIVDLTGKKYIKITDEVIKPDGVSVADVWERIGNKKSWYTPTLRSKIDKSDIPMFNSLSRNPGEEYPTF